MVAKAVCWNIENENDMKEKFRDKTRDDLIFALNSLGVGAEMADRGRPEEEVRKSLFRRSRGLVDLSDGPIAAINVLKQDRSQYSPPRWWVVLLIPSDLPGAADHPVKIRSHTTKSFPVFGQVTGFEWRGEDYGSGLIESLDQDRNLADLVKRVGDFEVQSHADDFDGWTIQIQARLRPEERDWQVLTKLARRLHSISY